MAEVTQQQRDMLTTATLLKDIAEQLSDKAGELNEEAKAQTKGVRVLMGHNRLQAMEKLGKSGGLLEAAQIVLNAGKAILEELEKDVQNYTIIPEEK